MKILILGGSRFFGRRLAELAIRQGDTVTLLNRGLTADRIEGVAERLICDRTQLPDLERVIGNREWDVIFDQVCYEAPQAQAAARLLAPRTRHFVFTSSQSVYPLGENATEEVFLAKGHSFAPPVKKEEDYAEAKRQCEAALESAKLTNLAMLRFPLVLGPDDYTGRLKFHVSRVLEGKPIFFPSPAAKISFIHADAAADTLYFFARKRLLGTFNAASPDPIELGQFMRMVEEGCGKTAVLAASATEENHSPYGVDSSWWMNTEKLTRAGMVIPQISAWLPALIEAMSQSESRG